ncbi:MAG: MATE family efflux transporter [Clostridiales bacterium]|nr:MATE family efflux transporter [Clostridiales bacterium]
MKDSNEKEKIEKEKAKKEIKEKESGEKGKNGGADLGCDSIGGLLFRLALPAILAQIVNLLYNMVDRMYIGHIPQVGSAALTGVGVTMPLIMCISAFAALVSMGGAPRASIMMGRKKSDEAESILGNCTAMLVLIALVLTIFIQWLGRDILMIFGASETTIPYAWSYMQIYSLGTIFVQLALGLNAFINAQGFAKIGMLTVTIGAVCNIILDPIFIFVLDLGVQGAALATILSQAVSCLWILRFFTGKTTKLHLRKKEMRLKPSIILPCIALGVSPFIMQFTESILNICFNTSLLKYGGDIAVGAMTILGSVMQFSMLPLQGLTQGSQPIVGFNYGAGKNERVKQTFRLLLFCCCCFTALTWSICMLAPGVFVGLFTNDAELAAFSCKSMRIYMAVSLLFGIQISCQQTFIALGNAKTSVILALLRKVVLLIPLIYIMPAVLPNKAAAVFLAEPVADILAVSATSILFYRQYKKL